MVRKNLQSGLTGKPVYTAAEVSATNIKTGAGTLVSISVLKKGAGTVICYDAITGTSGTIFSCDTTNFEGTWTLGIEFGTGLRWAKTGTAQVVVIYQ